SRAIDAIYAVHRAVPGHLTQRLADRHEDITAFQPVLLPTVIGRLPLTAYLLGAFAESAISSLRSLEEAAYRLARGDLRAEKPSGRGRDETRRVMTAVCEPTAALGDLLCGLVDPSRAVGAAADQLAAASSQSAQAAEAAT